MSYYEIEPPPEDIAAMAEVERQKRLSTALAADEALPGTDTHHRYLTAPRHIQLRGSYAT
jgi:hypothetical protein